jgi:zona occludens toxin
VPVNIYGGGTGSGKSYQVVSEIIVPQLAKGRRIMTTIRGVNYDRICEHLRVTEGLNQDQIGKLEVVAGALVRRPDFFPLYDEGVEQFDDRDSVVKLGTLVIIDEALRYFGTGEKLSPRVKQYLTEHRHAVDPATGQSSDLVLMSPDPTQFARLVRGITDYTFICRKHREIEGVGSYVVSMFQGKTLRKPLRTTVRKYDPLFFEFYESYAGGVGGKESDVDERQTVFTKKKMITVVVIIVLVFLFAFKGLSGFFAAGKTPPKTDGAAAAGGVASSVPGAVQAPRPVKPSAPNFSQRYRVVGFIDLGAARYVYVQEQGARIRAVRLPPDFYALDGHAVLSLDGEVITDFTGAVAAEAKTSVIPGSSTK